MIKSDITAYIGSYALDGVIEIPSRVLTSTVQDEELNLTYTPNFQLKLNDSYGYFNAQCLKVDFTVDSYNYSAYMYKVNSAADGTVTVQYAGGLEQGETPEPEPVPSITSISFDAFNSFTDNDMCNDIEDYTGNSSDILYFTATDADSSFSDDIKACGIASVSDNERNDITSYCTFSSNGWIKDQIDENEYCWTYLATVSADDNNTEYSIVITASYTTSDSRTLNDNITLKYYLTSTGTEPEPEEHTLAFELNNYSCSFDLYSNETSNSEFVINYDGEPIDLSYWSGDSLPLSGMVHCAVQEIIDDDQLTGAWEFYASWDTVGDYNDTVEFTYNGLTAYTTVSVTITETEPEPDYYASIYNRAGTSDYSLCTAYDVSEQDVNYEWSTEDMAEYEQFPSNTYASIKIFDGNTSEEVELTTDNFSMTANGKSLVYWDDSRSNWQLDLHDSASQGLTVEDFVGSVTITVNGISQDITLSIFRPIVCDSFEGIYEARLNQQVIFNLYSGNNKMYLVDAYAPGTGAAYYKDIIVNDGQGNSMLIYNTDSNVADTTNFTTRPDTDYTGQSLTCQEMVWNGPDSIDLNSNRINWIAGTIQTFRNGYQIQSSNLPAFTLDSSSTISVDILYPETTSISSINMSNRYPIKIEAGTISASGANGSVEFTDPESGETVTINIFRVDTSTSTDTYNGLVCTLTGIYNAMGNVIDWTSLTSNS